MCKLVSSKCYCAYFTDSDQSFVYLNYFKEFLKRVIIKYIFIRSNTYTNCHVCLRGLHIYYCRLKINQVNYLAVTVLLIVYSHNNYAHIWYIRQIKLEIKKNQTFQNIIQHYLKMLSLRRTI